MPTFYPSLETIAKFKVPPTEGERTLLDFLVRVLDESYEVYFTPYLNGDRPDVIIMHKGHGVMVIEVKDWNLDNFSLNEKKKWVYIPNGAIVKSPIDQVLKYKNNLYDLHVDQLLEKKISDKRNFRIVTCAVYFHCANQDEVNQLLVNPYKDDRKYQDFIKYNIDLIGKDGLVEDNFKTILKKRHLDSELPSLLFLGDIYENFKRILSPSVHLIGQGETYLYSNKQKEIIYSTTLEQRIKGVYGSGKTTVLAARAVQAYKRALERNSVPRILILTYNITLKNFIHDKLKKVDETFHEENFIIINYHQFINAELNNLNIDIEEIDSDSSDVISETLDSKVYSNIALFEENKERIKKYDAVLIDEIQDFRRPWMDIIKNYFRDPKGDYVLFGDVKQNIYGQPTSQKDVVTNVLGVNELKYCFRSQFKIRDLTQSFQKNIFKEKYDIDEFEENNTIGPLGLTIDKGGYINYMYLSDKNTIVALFNIIWGNIKNKVNNVSPNDITILGYTANQLRFFDCYYRYASREKTTTMMETIEAMYMTHLNYIGKKNDDSPHAQWFKSITDHVRGKMFKGRENLTETDLVKLRQKISILFTLYDLYSLYPSTFEKRLKEECEKSGIVYNAYIAYRKHFETIIQQFKSEVYNDNYKNIRNNKKLHFWMNSGKIKISTINSFKGWESEVVFLIIEPTIIENTYFNHTFDELLYTGITRARKNLVIINFGNKEYDQKIRPLVESIK